MLPKNKVFSWSEASKSGHSRRELAKLIDHEQILQVRRGYYIDRRSKIPPQHLDYVLACKHFGSHAAIGGLTALSFYGLTEQVPSHIWVIVTSTTRSSQNLYRLIRTKVPLKIGVIDNGDFRITSLERTIVDAFKFSTKIGLHNAIYAARRAISNKQTTATKIAQMAKEMGQFKAIQKYWETFT